VPETSVYEDGDTMSRKHQVGLPRQIGSVQPKTKAQSMRDSAHTHLRPGILAVNAGHVATAAFGVELVHSPSRPELRQSILSASTCGRPCAQVLQRVEGAQRYRFDARCLFYFH